jgi:uncharacterized protein (DUF2126 family)
VLRIHEDPRVTKPYRDDQWTAIDALGRAVDARLKEYDVRLTMGGEPTFVSIDDMESAQWNSAALGTHKLERAQDLWKRLAARFAPNGLRHSGQGKWYPGEPLPRWALGIHWRPTACPCGTTRPCSPTKAATTATPWTPRASASPWPAGEAAWASPNAICRPATRTPCIICCKEAQVPINLDPSPILAQTCKTPPNGAASPTNCRAASTIPVGYVSCRSPGTGAATLEKRPWNFRRARLYLIARRFAHGPAPAHRQPALGGPRRTRKPSPLDLFAPRDDLPDSLRRDRLPLCRLMPECRRTPGLAVPRPQGGAVEMPAQRPTAPLP